MAPALVSQRICVTVCRYLHCNESPYLCIQSQFPHSCVCKRFIYSQDRSTYFPPAEQVDRSRKCINRSRTHECGNWPCNSFAGNFLFQIFGIVSLQCAPRYDKRNHRKYVTEDILQYRSGLTVNLVKPVIKSGLNLNPDLWRFSDIKIPSKLSSLSYVEKLNFLPGSGS